MDNQGQQVAIIIRAKDNPMPAMLLGSYEVGTLKDFVILEGGTSGGKTSVAFHIKVGNKSIVVQTTAAIFGGLHSSLVGADQRFNEGKPTNPDLPFIDALNEVIALNIKEQTIDHSLISDTRNTFGDLYNLLSEAKGRLLKDCQACGYEASVLTSNEETIEKITKALTWQS